MKIMITETAHVIWKLRNAEAIRGERVVKAKAEATLREAIARFAKVDLDKIKIKRQGRQSKHLEKDIKVILGTWRGLIGHLPVSFRWDPSDYG